MDKDEAEAQKNWCVAKKKQIHEQIGATRAVTTFAERQELYRELQICDDMILEANKNLYARTY